VVKQTGKGGESAISKKNRKAWTKKGKDWKSGIFGEIISEKLRGNTVKAEMVGSEEKRGNQVRDVSSRRPPVFR